MSSITKRVIEYLKLHHTAKPSEIANYLGVSVKLVRVILFRLREKGIVVKTDRGYTLKVDANINSVDERLSIEVDTAKNSMGVDAREFELRVLELSNKLSTLEKRISNIENILNELKSMGRASGIENSLKLNLLPTIIETLDIIKMALQAIAIGDRNSLNTTLEALDDILDKLREKLIEKHHSRY